MLPEQKSQKQTWGQYWKSFSPVTRVLIVSLGGAAAFATPVAIAGGIFNATALLEAIVDATAWAIGVEAEASVGIATLEAAIGGFTVTAAVDSTIEIATTNCSRVASRANMVTYGTLTEEKSVAISPSQQLVELIEYIVQSLDRKYYHSVLDKYCLYRQLYQERKLEKLDLNQKLVVALQATIGSKLHMQASDLVNSSKLYQQVTAAIYATPFVALIDQTKPVTLENLVALAIDMLLLRNHQHYHTLLDEVYPVYQELYKKYQDAANNKTQMARQLDAGENTDWPIDYQIQHDKMSVYRAKRVNAVELDREVTALLHATICRPLVATNEPITLQNLLDVFIEILQLLSTKRYHSMLYELHPIYKKLYLKYIADDASTTDKIKVPIQYTFNQGKMQITLAKEFNVGEFNKHVTDILAPAMNRADEREKTLIANGKPEVLVESEEVLQSNDSLLSAAYEVNSITAVSTSALSSASVSSETTPILGSTAVKSKVKPPVPPRPPINMLFGVARLLQNAEPEVKNSQVLKS